MAAFDYIEAGNGVSVKINEAGMSLFNTWLSRNGGGVALSEATGLDENTISAFKNNKRCAPDTWYTIYTHITKQPAAVDEH